jgi:hypothetical protein
MSCFRHVIISMARLQFVQSLLRMREDSVPTFANFTGTEFHAVLRLFLHIAIMSVRDLLISVDTFLAVATHNSDGAVA